MPRVPSGGPENSTNTAASRLDPAARAVVLAAANAASTSCGTPVR